MPIQPIDYTSGNSGFLQGIQTAYDLKQAQQQNQAIDENNQFKQDWQNTNGDPEKMNALMMKYPGQMQTISQGIGYQNDNHRAALGAAAGDIWTAMQTGNPQAVAQAATKHASTLATVGSSPDEISSMLQNDPQQLGHLINTVRMTSLTPDQYATVQQNNAKLQQDGTIAGAKYQLDNQKFQYQQQQDNIQNGFEGQKIDIQRGDQAIRQQTANQSGQQQSASQQNQQFQQINKKQEFVGGYDQQVNNVSGMLTTLNQVKQINPDIWTNTFGSRGAVNRVLAPFGSDTADAWNQIEQMQAQARQMGVVGMKGTGPVSDSEGQAAANAFLSLDRNVSPERARAIVNNWQSVLQRQTNYLRSQRPLVDKYRSDIQSYSGPQQQQGPLVGYTENGYTYTGGDPSSPNSWRKN